MAVQEIEVPDDLIKPEVTLIGQDGNAFNIMGICKRELEKAGNSKEVVESYMEQSMNGDYNHLLRVAMSFCEVTNVSWIRSS